MCWVVFRSFESLAKKIKWYLVATILAKHYQQFAGPLYSHAAAVIAFQDPENNEKNGFILLDPSFHIAEPILLFKSGHKAILAKLS